MNTEWRAPTIRQLQVLLEGHDVLEMLGQGGMGAVYKVRQVSFARHEVRVAEVIAMQNPDQSRPDPEVSPRTEAEAEGASQ